MKLSGILGFFGKCPFPKAIKGHNYCVCWYMHVANERDAGRFKGSRLSCQSIETPAQGKAAFNHYTMGIHGRDTSGLIDGLIPAVRIEGQIGLYKITGSRYRTNSNYDGAPWDDGYKIDLEYVRSVKAQNPELLEVG